MERCGVYQAGKSAHNHQVGAGAFTAAKVVAEVKKRALEEKFKPASAIVQEVNMFEDHIQGRPVKHTEYFCACDIHSLRIIHILHF